MNSIRPIARTAALALGALLALTNCSSESSEPAGSSKSTSSPAAQLSLPDSVAITDPDQPLANMDLVEDESEAVANRFIDFADKLRRRDFSSAAEWLTESFAAHAFDGSDVLATKSLPLGAESVTFDPASAPIVGGAEFLASIGRCIGPWARMEFVQWKVKAAEFQRGRPQWGKIKFKITFQGTGPDGGPRTIVAWAWAKVIKRAAKWQLDRLELTKQTHRSRAQALFTDVSTSSGVAHSGIRFGQPGNKSYAWNGAASGDANGDGRFDVFTSSRPRNFLYIAAPGGGFNDEAEPRGLAEPAGGTGSVFFDFDNDGDQDLAIADVGWTAADGTLHGNPLRLYENQGDGKFALTDRGLNAQSDGYSLTVLDAELDGFLDLFVCNYGRVANDPNNSWTDADNGSPNALYSNEGGEKFRDVARERGLADTRWTYASASADFDQDGDADLYCANDYAPNTLWENTGKGVFRDATAALGISDRGNGMGTAWGDLSDNGRLDLYVANMSSTAGSRILRRISEEAGAGELIKYASGNSIFLSPDPDPSDAAPSPWERLPSEAGGIDASWAWSTALVDLDLDGRLDVFCANGFITGNTPADT